MKKVLYLLLVVVFVYPPPGNTQELSTLFRTGMSNVDTVRIKEQVNYASSIHNHSPDSAQLLLQQTLQWSKEGNYRPGIILSYIGLAFNRFDSKSFKTGKQYMDSAYYYCFLPGTVPLDPRITALVNNAMAGYHTLVGNNNIAISYYYASLQHLTLHQIKDKRLIIVIYNNIGATFMKLNLLDKALYYSHKSAELALQEGDTQQLNAAYHNIASAYQDKGSYKEAESYYRKAIQHYKSHNQQLNLQEAYYGLGRNYLFQDEPQEALKNFHAAMRADSMAAKNNSSLLQGIGGAYYMLGKYGLAEQHYLNALKICEQEHLVTERLSIYSTLAKIYDKRGQHQLAYSNQVAFSDLYDSLYKEKIVQATNELEVKYRVSEKDKDITQKQLMLLQQQGRIREKNIWISGIAIGTLALGILFVALFRNKRHKERLHKQLITNLEKEKEINTLRARVEGEEEERVRLARDLHDGVVVQFSAVKMNLSVLPEEHPSLLGAADYTKIIRNLNMATHDLRKTAHNLLPDSLLENGLSEAVFFFCKDLQQSSGILIDFQQFTTLPRLHATIELSLYRIVQELLQNIVKHSGATRAIVQLSYNEHLLQITIEDNGSGFKASTTETATKGIGLKNIYARMSTLNGHVEIESRDTGTTVYLELDTDKYLATEA